MIATLLLMATAAALPPDQSGVFACSWAESEQSDPLAFDTVSLVATRYETEGSQVWKLEWEDARVAAASARSVEPWTYGERTALRWTENGKDAHGFVSALPDFDGREMVLITLGDVARDAPPGYVCLTAPVTDGSK